MRRPALREDVDDALGRAGEMRRARGQRRKVSGGLGGGATEARAEEGREAQGAEPHAKTIQKLAASNAEISGRGCGSRRAALGKRRRSQKRFRANL